VCNPCLDVDRHAREEAVAAAVVEMQVGVDDAGDVARDVLGVRLADRRLHVRRSYWGKTKTGRTRSLTVPASDLAALRAFRSRERERLFAVGVHLDEETTILTNGLGEPVTPKYLGQTFTIWARKAGLDCTYHGLRHTAASLLISTGTDVRTVASRLGHASPTTTLAIYSHLIQQATWTRPTGSRRCSPVEASPVSRRLVQGENALLGSASESVLHLLTGGRRHAGGRRHIG
jgi:site-specific recombinase XerC